MTRTRIAVIALVGLAAACAKNSPARAPDGGSTAIAQEPLRAPPSAAIRPVAPAPTVPVASGSAGAAPGMPSAVRASPAGSDKSGICRTHSARESKDIVGSERTLSGAGDAVIDIVPGERLCIQTRDKGRSLVGVELVQTPEHPDRTVSISLARADHGGYGATLRIENPYPMMLHYTLEAIHEGQKKREPVVACPAGPGKAKSTHLPGNVTHVFVSDLHLRGPGTAGSMLCQ